MWSPRIKIYFFEEMLIQTFQLWAQRCLYVLIFLKTIFLPYFIKSVHTKSTLQKLCILKCQEMKCKPHQVIIIAKYLSYHHGHVLFSYTYREGFLWIMYPSLLSCSLSSGTRHTNCLLARSRTHKGRQENELCVCRMYLREPWLLSLDKVT